ncbi:MAG: threonine--tRNA ligase [Candidatus Micrarchaeota archaeon]|nr:threonine--tRNA ligase [Candidatus Micrarchaeota archaeon]
MHVNVKLPDGKLIKVEKGIRIIDLAKQISNKLAYEGIVARMNNKLVDMSTMITEDSELEILLPDSKEGLETIRHSCSHVMAQAILRLYPDAQLTIGPVVEDGFYYDIYLTHNFTPEDLKKIEQEMENIIKEDQPFERVELAIDDVINLYLDNQFKQEIIEELRKDGHKMISVYYNRKTNKSPTNAKEFYDMCTGPHVPSTGRIKAFKLMKVAAAYWRGDAKNQQLQRIYGTAFASKKDLEDYVKRIEEAEKRDHRKLGKELNLIMMHEFAPGMIFFLPKGFIIRQELENFIREEQKKRNYQEVRTPIILNEKLWHISGHIQHYKENMYFTNIDEQSYAIKPMNCPGHMLIFKNQARSYRELPLRISEMGLVHRHELSGVLTGMVRVRSFVQDDSHIFIAKEQIEEEVLNVINLVKTVLEVFNFEYHAELSTRPEKFMGDLETWNYAEQALKNSLEKAQLKYTINEGDGAFYGPKIDFKVKDAIGRVWQLSTIQLDFQMPKKFELNYEGKDGKQHTPIVIHRAVFGSFERFIGILIEHYSGKFPVWLSPVQIALLPISDEYLDYAKELEKKFKDKGFRVVLNDKQETINAKIRDAQLEKIPYMLVIGKKEKETHRLTVRERNGKQYELEEEEFVNKIELMIKQKKNIE